MNIEYSNEIKGLHFAYRFNDWEKKTIAKCLYPEISKIERKISKLDNHPKNEGQATYSNAIRELNGCRETLLDIISEFDPYLKI